MAIQRRRLAKGVHYRARIFLGVVGGKRVEMAETFSTRKEAERWEREHTLARDKGVLVVPSDRKLCDYLRAWLDGALRLRVRERTWRDYERDLSRAGLLPPEPARKNPRVPSELAFVPLNRLTPGHLERFYVALAVTGMPQKGCKPLGARSVRYVHALLHAALKSAVRNQLLALNPADGVQLPKATTTSHNSIEAGAAAPRLHALSGDQVNALLATAALPPPVREGERRGVRGPWRYTPPGDRNRFHALWHVLVKGGLRPNEGLGLTWNDVEWDRSAVRVNRTLVRGVTGGGWKAEEPKTKQSRRLVTLPADTMAALRQQREAQTAEQETMTQAERARYRDHGFVFAGRGGEPLDLKNITARHFVPLLAAAGLPRIRVYDLRHTHATLLLSAGVPVHVVSKRLGHASAKMTLEVYAHVLPGQQEEAVERMEEYLSAVR
jgi:integrase